VFIDFCPRIDKTALFQLVPEGRSSAAFDISNRLGRRTFSFPDASRLRGFAMCGAISKPARPSPMGGKSGVYAPSASVGRGAPCISLLWHNPN
jgi:hypothetical protein